MTKNPEDEKLVAKGVVKKELEDAIRTLPREPGMFFTKGSLCDRLQKGIDKLPTVKIKSPEQIERAIEYLEREAEGRLKEAGAAVSMLAYWEVADLFRLIIGQKQLRKFWDEEEVFGKAESGKVGE